MDNNMDDFENVSPMFPSLAWIPVRSLPFTSYKRPSCELK